MAIKTSKIEGRITKGIYKDKHLEIIFGEFLRKIQIKIGGELITTCASFQIEGIAGKLYPTIKLGLISMEEKENEKKQ